jgi:hypothetical protein
LYQGVFGVGHLITERAWEILVEESNRINLYEQVGDPLIENISPDDTFARVNLRQYLNQGYSLRPLYKTMKKSANYKGDINVFHIYWNSFKELVYEGVLDFQLDEINKLNKMIENKGVTPRHHSEAYRVAYYPAYRVVLQSIIDKDIKGFEQNIDV